MKERPILFSGEMVRAILDGRKTQTRRIVKPQTLELFEAAIQLGEVTDFFTDAIDVDWAYVGGFCPYGQRGDRLWARETWGKDDSGDFVFRADDWCECPTADGKWKSSIFMHRAASRITLEITAVRVERLQDISEEDAKAEGVRQCEGGWWNYIAGEPYQGMTARGSYETIWELINGPGSWEKNPWVWVIEFRRLAE